MMNDFWLMMLGLKSNIIASPNSLECYPEENFDQRRQWSEKKHEVPLWKEHWKKIVVQGETSNYGYDKEGSYLSKKRHPWQENTIHENKNM